MQKKIVALMLLALLGLVSLPLGVANAALGGPYTVGVAIQNLSASTANIALQFFDQSGAATTGPSDTIAPGANKTYFPLPSVASGFNGSLVVSSDQQIAATANVVFPDLRGQTTYNSFSSGSTTVNLPLMMRGNAGFLDTWFNVQNVGSAAATVNVKYTGGCTASQTVQPSSSKTFDQSATGCLADGYVGAAVVTSTQPLVATVMEIQRPSGPRPNQLSSYNGWTASNTVLVMPIVSSNFFNSGTGIAIQNTGASSTNVTLTYTPAGGSFPGASCTETHTIGAGQFGSFGFPQLPAACGTTGSGVTDPVNKGFVGSAKVTTNSASMPLVAIVNQINRVNANADAYNAINPATATSKVSMPLIMDRNFGFFTGISIANVGTSSTNIACTFTGTGYTIPSTAVAPGAALTDVELNKIANGYVGSGTCTATGGDAKIAGIVNQLKSGIPATNDGVSDYAAFNY